MTGQVQRPWRRPTTREEPARGRRKWLLLGGLCLAGLAGAWLVWGRDRAGHSRHIPVEGQVFFDGRPLSLHADQIGKVWFYPDARQPNACPTTPSSDIDEDGRYTLSTGGQPGIPPGRYWVMLIATQPSDPRRPFHRRKSLIPGRYCAVETSGLVFEVTSGAPSGAYDLRLRK